MVMMKRNIIISTGVLISACSSVDHKADVFKSLDNSTALYVCYYFFRERGETSDDILQKNKLNQVSSSILVQAQSTAIEAGGDRLDKKVSIDAKVRYERFINKILNINASTDRNNELSKFLKSCADLSGVIFR